jgi:hypothetical protein
MRRIARVLPLIALLLAGGCASVPADAPVAVPRSHLWDPPPYRDAADIEYDQARVAVTLGPHRLYLARQWLRDGHVPDGGWRVELALWLPDFSPVFLDPPVASVFQAAMLEMVVDARDADVSPDVFARWSPELPLAAAVARVDEAPRHPPQPVFGLQRYALDLDALRREAEARGERVDRVASPYAINNQDVFIATDARGDLQRWIECTPHAVNDGLVVEDGLPVVRPGPAVNSQVMATCMHTFLVMPQNLRVTMSYARAYLSDWQRMETVVRQRLADAMRPSPSP